MEQTVCLTEEAFVTLATNDSYAVGALVLGSSLKAVGTTRSMAVMITNGVSSDLR
jgi:glycogenin